MSSSSQPTSSSSSTSLHESHQNERSANKQDDKNNFINSLSNFIGPSGKTQDDKNNLINETILINNTRKVHKTLEGIRQFFVNIEREEWKLECLSDLFEVLPISQMVIYCKNRETVDLLAEEMGKQDFAVTTMHEGMEQKDCDVIIREFRSGSNRVLITTDVVALAFDSVLPQVAVIINYDLPTLLENYIDRVGRTGHIGRKGLAINMVTEEDLTYLKDIEMFYHTKLDERPHNVGDLL